MSVKKITLATLLLATLTACSSGGGSSSQADDLQNKLNQANMKLAESEKAKVEAEQAKSDADKSVKTLENQLNSAKSDLAQAQQALQQAQADKNTTAEQLKTAQANLANAEKTKQAVENQLNSAKTELTTAQTEKAKAEEALENKKKVVDEIVAKAKETMESLGYQGQRIGSVSGKPDLPSGLSKHPFINLTADEIDGIFVGNQYVYVSPNSDMKIFTRGHTAFWNDTELKGERGFRVEQFEGTRTVDLPQGTATYQGKVFAGDTQGDLNYEVDFGEKTGSGNIRGFTDGLPNISLAQGDITSRGVGENHRIRADAQGDDGSTGRYFLDFFGENAESIGGKLYMYKQFDGVPTSNNAEAVDFEAEKQGINRGTVFGIAGERR